jgi:hypothetical protein
LLTYNRQMLCPLKSKVKDTQSSGICRDERGPAVHGVQQRALPSLRCLQHPAPHAPRGHCLSRDTGRKRSTNPTHKSGYHRSYSPSGSPLACSFCFLSVCHESWVHNVPFFTWRHTVHKQIIGLAWYLTNVHF